MTDPQDPRQSDEPENISLVSEFFYFVRENKKWWLVPLVVMFAGLAVLIFASGNAALAPFIYSFF